MPHILVDTPTGVANIYYNISTPEHYSASNIDPSLPCILFFHPEWASQDVFEAQFSDALLRKHFNLIAMDTRAHGGSTGPVKAGVFTVKAAGEEVCCFFKALKLPPVHGFGISMGCNLLLEFAQAFPDYVLSMTLCSLRPPKEPEDLMAGRRQLNDFWNKSFKQEGGNLAADSLLDAEMLRETIYGGMQSMYSGRITPVVYPLMNKIFQNVVNHWVGSPEKMEIGKVVCLKWFEEKSDWDFISLAKVKGPIVVIHNSNSIAYGDIQPTEKFIADLKRAGHENVTLQTINGAHLSIITNPEEVNEIIFNQVILASYGEEKLKQLSGTFPMKSYALQTPFTAELVRYGYEPNPEHGAWSISMQDFEPTYPISALGLQAFMQDHYPSK